MGRPARGARLVLAAAAIIAAAVVSLPLRDCLVVRTGCAKTAALFPLGREDPAFIISWRHSVTREPCAEYYRRAEGGRIALYRTVFKGLGAGLPFGDEGGRVSIQDGAIVIDGMERTLPRIVLAALPLTEHRLQAGRREAAVLSLLDGEHVAVFTIEKKSLARIAMAMAGLR